MASKAVALNVRLGVIFDEKTLAATEKALRRSGEKLSRIGSDLTLSLSAPLGLFGGAAIKAAGDLESLTLALQSQLGSAEKAGAELEKLQKIAENPGLGLEQAVGASIRLQGVGIAANDAREIIKQLGNAIASTGGTAQEFDNVTRQFTQMISKGRVLQEDISVISESMPNIAQLMQKAFGTQSVEGIRDMGIGAKEFVAGITAAAAELPRVKSGIKNNIENAMDAVKIALGKVGLAINDAFDIKGGLEKFAKFITDAAAAFDSLNSATKTAIAYFGAFLIAIGPIAKVLSSIQLVSSLVVSGWGSLVKGMGALVTWAGQVRTAFLALSLSMQAFIGIGIIVAVTALANEFGLFNRQLTSAEKSMQMVNDLTAQAKAETAGERAQVESLIKILTDENTKREDKIEALNELKSINPQYFGQLTVETAAVGEAAKAYEGYAQSILKAARAKGAEAQLIELDKQRETQVKALAEAERQYNATRKERVGLNRNDGDFNAGGNTAEAFLKAKEALKNTEDQIATIKQVVDGYAAERVALQAATTAQTEAANAAAAASAKKQQASEAAIEAAKKMQAVYKEVQADITAQRDYQNVLGAKDVIEEAQTIESGIKKLLDAGFKPTSKEIENLHNQLKALFKDLKVPPVPEIPTLQPKSVTSTGEGQADTGIQPGQTTEVNFSTNIDDIVDKVKNGIALTEEEMAKFREYMKGNWKESIAQSFQAVSDAFFTIVGMKISQNAEEETARLEAQYAKRIEMAKGDANRQAQLQAELESKRAAIQKEAGKKKKRAAIAEAIVNTAVAVTKTFAELGFVAGLPAAIAQGVAGAAQIAVIASQQFARGTAFAPGGMALVGEKGPELVNIPRGSQVISNMRTNRLLEGMGQSGGVMQGEFTVRGTDLVLVLERAQSKQGRAF